MLKRILATITAISVMISTVSLEVFAKISPGTDYGYNKVVSSKEYAISPGVTETDLVLNNDQGTAQNKGFLLEVDLKNPTTHLVATYKDHNPSVWGLQPLTDQAAAAEKALKKDPNYGEDATVVGAVNANFFNMGTGEPIGAFVMNGKVIQNTNRDYGYLAIFNDGRAEVRKGTTAIGDNVAEAVAGYEVLVLDGKNLQKLSHDSSKRQPRNVVGIKADGSMLFFLADGRQAPSSHGMTLYEVAELMISMGCVQALRLDDGGSATMASRREGSDKLSIINSPSDGAPRAVSSSLLVVSTAKPSGVFDHASITPNDELYTPNTNVQFEAQGIDSAGMSVPLPDGIKWALDTNSEHLGVIDPETGNFASNGQTGVVNVQLKLNDEVVGTTSIEIITPDAIEFASDEISLGFEDTTNFGLVLRNKGREITHKVGDVNWLISDPKLGTFNGNEFTSSDGESLNGIITAVSAFDSSVSQSIHVIVGMLPTVVMDFEDYIDPVTGQKIPAKEYYTIGNKQGDGSKYFTSNYGRGGKQSAEIVSIDDDEPVRFGNYSLKLNYDFRNCGAVTEGANFGTSDLLTVPGSPTGIGVWVYAPEGTGVKWEGDGTQAGFWLRGYVRDGNGVNMPYDFTLEPKNVTGDQQPGIYWEGWKYLEADLTKLQAPFSIQPGMTFRLMYVAGTGMGTKTAGSIYFDNLQFVYGANVDDIDSPVIDSITANNIELTDGMEINSNKVTFSGNFYDVLNKYTSGIDKDTIRMYIDGVNVAGNDNFNYVVDPDGSKAHLYDVTLLNGQHSLTVSLRDKFGNDTSKTIYFTIKGQNLGVPTINVSTKESSAILGETVTIEIRANDATNISKNTTSFKLNKQFLDYEVIASENYDVTSSFNKITDTLTLDATRKMAGTSNDGLIASIKVKIPATLNEQDQFTYTVKAGSYLVNDVLYTYSTSENTLPVGATYDLTSEPIIVGENGVLKVTDSNNNPAANVTVYLQDNTVVGQTDENGILITDKFSTKAGDYVVYVKDTNGKISFYKTVSSYNPQGNIDGTPFNILNNAVKDPATQKNISWMTNPKFESTQVVQYRLNNTTAWKTVDVNSKDVIFTKEANNIVQVNNVVLTGLMANTTYQYRVGCENKWSEIMTFVTNSQNRPVNFFIFGDVQADDMTNINALLENVGKQNYAFGIQTGDAVDDAISYQNWKEMLELLDVNSLKDTDLIHVLGNHEYSGDGNGLKASEIYNLPVNKAGGYYSVTYGNVYAAVINYTGTASQLQEALDWLKEDASNSDAKWKILTMHQPPYYTNVAGGNNQINAMVPPVVDELGIDFVFSGHDHSYARTEPLKDRVVDQDGTVYFISGSSGEKSYTITNNPDFHFAKATQDFNAIYLGVKATQNDITVTTYDVQADGTANVIDTYTKSIDTCVNDEHTYLYDVLYDELICSECGYTVSARESLYAGFAHEKESGKLMYFTAGKAATGHQYISSTHYYFDANGYAFDGNIQLCGEVVEFKDGQFVKGITADIIVAGISGKHVEFVFYTNGTLKIGGYGDMEDYATSGTLPWYEKRHSITKIEIGKDITSLGVYAFRGATKCASVTFEEGSKLSNIKGSAFYYLSNLTSITLPENVKSIGNYSFGYNTKLTYVYIPASVTSINKTAFNNCDKAKLVLDVQAGSYAEKYAKENGIKYVTRKLIESVTLNKTELELLKDSTETLVATINPSDTTSSKDLVWKSSNSKVATVDANGKVTAKGIGTAVITVTTSNGKTAECKVTVIDKNQPLYSGMCGKNVKWELFSDGLLKLSGSGEMTNYTSNANTPWFNHRHSIKKIEIGADITSIGVYAFKGAINCTKVVFEEGSKCTNIGGSSFNYLSSLKEITLPETVKTIGNYSFGYCKNLEKVYVPASVTNINKTAFNNCDKAKLVLDVQAGSYAEKYAKENGIKYVTRKLIESVTLNKTELELLKDSTETLVATINPSDTTSSKDLVWKSSNSKVATVDANGKVTAKGIGTAVITVTTSNGKTAECKVTVIDKNQPLYSGMCGKNVKWELFSDGLLKLSGSGEMTNYTSNANTPWFNHRHSIKKIEIGADITSIGVYAFKGAINCTKVVFEEGSKCTNIGGSSFNYLSSLKEITLPETVKTIGNYSFGYCKNLEKVYVPVSVTSINKTAFNNCDKAKLVLDVRAGSYAETYAKENEIKYVVR